MGWRDASTPRSADSILIGAVPIRICSFPDVPDVDGKRGLHRKPQDEMHSATRVVLFADTNVGLVTESSSSDTDRQGSPATSRALAAFPDSPATGILFFTDMVN